MASEAVVNASPLIFLSRANRLDLFRHIAEIVHVPRTVADEIGKRGPQDVTAVALSGTPWIRTVEVSKIPDEILVWGLGPGESAVLAHALLHPATEAIIDDLAGRRCAASLGIPIRGTLGIVLIAKKRGLVPNARALIEDLIRSGLYLSRTVLDEALKRVGE